MGTVVLVCAVMAATAAGVLVAYGVCVAMFGIFRIHARKVAERYSPIVLVADGQVAEA